VKVLSSEEVSHPHWTVAILTTFDQRVVMGSVLGLNLGGELWARWGWPILIALSVGLVTYLLALAVRASSNRLLAAIAIGTGVAMFLISGYTRDLGPVMVWPVDYHHGLGARYAIVPTLLVLSGLMVLLDTIRHEQRGGWRWAAPATAVLLLLPLITSFDAGSGRGMPSWSASLARATTLCRTGNAEEASVSIAPEGWTMTIPCSRLESE